MQIVTPALPSEDDSASRAVLRDGTVATLRLAQTGDREILRRFFHDLSPESRRRRFHGYGEPTDALLDRLSDSSDLSRAATLLVLRVRDGESRPIAVGSFVAIDAVAAEAAFAVDDQFQGRGLGTLLLERLAAIAAAHGFRRFDAMTLADNSAMLEVFHDSGFEIRSKSDSGAINVQLSRPSL